MNKFSKGLSILAITAMVPFAAQADEPDLGKGEKVFKKCQACHTLEDGGANKIGPNLFGMFTRPAASAADFNYSDAMSTKAEEIGVWTAETLDEYLTKPRDYIPGTNMAFAGLRKESQRTNLIAYLQQQTGAAEAEPAAE